MFVSLSLTGGARAQSASCGFALPSSGSTPLPATSRGLILDADDAAFAMAFGDSRTPQARAIEIPAYQVELESTKGLKLKLGSGYLRDGNGHTISLNERDGLYGTLAVASPRALKLCLEVRPEQITQLRPGRWVGMVAVVAGVNEVSLTAVPVELTFRASRWNGTMIALLGVLLGLLVKIFSEAAVGQRERGIPAREALKAYMTQLSFPATLILAGVAGWLVFSQVYTGDPDWGASSADTTKLLAACFIAQMSSVEGLDLAKRIAGATPVVQPAATGRA